MKNTMAATPYMMPMRLWSTVVIQLFQPVVAVGLVNTPSGRCTLVVPGGRAGGEGAWCSTIAMVGGSYLVERLEEGDQLVDLLLGQVEVRHPPDLLPLLEVVQRCPHRLLPGRVAQPGLQVGTVQRAADLVGVDQVVAVDVLPQVEGGAGEGSPAREVRQVGRVLGDEEVPAAAELL